MEKIPNELLEKLIFDVKKPARYIGGELNQIIKNNPFIKTAICYPDLYEIGMSNNGIRILYDIINKIEDTSCERVFAVDLDFENKARSLDIPLYTLETHTPLYSLDLIGFNISHELLYTNILQVIDLGQIPVYADKREEKNPLIIAGGASASNPEPVRDFIDAFYIGDGEEGIVDIIDAIRTGKRESLKRLQVLELLNDIPGIYVPKLSKGKKITKRIYRGKFKDPADPVIPSIRITQERYVSEITRGCKNFCRFCHAGYYELPYRYNRAEEVRDRIIKIIEKGYYTELTLSSLSINDYKYLIELLNQILPLLNEKGISISLPSLKVDKETLEVIENISDLRRTSLTFAVESACEEIREKANKKMNTDELLTIAEHVFSRGWKKIKLYFMLGLPGCEDNDEAEPIIQLLRKIERTGGRKNDINVTLSPFVPKPHTPFQWEKQMDAEYFFNTIMKIKKALPGSISIKAHDVYSSLLEGIMSRGDNLLCDLIYSSYKNGCRLDSWGEHFKFDIWRKNLDAIIPDWKEYLQPKDEKAQLHWDFISTGYEGLVRAQKNRSKGYTKINRLDKSTGLDRTALQESIRAFETKYSVLSRVRLKFTKTGSAKYIPHLDFIEIIKRALRIAGIPVSFTQGFNKRERLSLGFPVPIGIESLCELCDVDLYEIYPADKIKNKLAVALPHGFTVHSVKTVTGKKSLMSLTSAIEYDIYTEDRALLDKLTSNLEKGINFNKESKKGIKTITFSDAIYNFKIEKLQEGDGKVKISIVLYTGTENSMRIDNVVLALIESSYEQFYKFRIVKTNQYEKVYDKMIAMD